MNRLALLLATWFGCGYWPWGPGTAGSLAAIAIAAALNFFLVPSRTFLIGLVIVFLLPAIWSSTRAEHLLNRKDPGNVVIDEVVGQWLTLAGAAALNWKTLLAGFILFRVFDIWKPWPVRQFEKLPEGSGIVADDLAAGIYGALILYIGGRFGLY